MINFNQEKIKEIFLKALIKIFSVFMTTLFIVAIIIYYVVTTGFNYDLGDGYSKTQFGRSQDYILKNEKVYMLPAIVSLDYTNDFIAGLRLRVEPVICIERVPSLSKGHDIMVRNEQLYFIIDKRNDEVFHFKSDDKFKLKMGEFDIMRRMELDYSQFDYVFNRTNDRYTVYSGSTPYYSTCKPSGKRASWRFDDKVIIDGVWE